MKGAPGSVNAVGCSELLVWSPREPLTKTHQRYVHVCSVYLWYKHLSICHCRFIRFFRKISSTAKINLGIYCYPSHGSYTYRKSQGIWLVLCCAVLWFGHVGFIHIFQDYFAGTSVVKRLSKCQWNNTTLWWRHNDHDSVSNHQPHECLFKRLFRRRSKKRSKLRVTGLCVGNSPGPVNSPHKGPVTWKMFPFDDVIMKENRCMGRLHEPTRNQW